MANEMKESELALPEPIDIVIDNNLTPATVLNNWRTSMEAETLHKNHLVDYFQKQSRQYFEYQPERPGMVKCIFKETEAKEGIINILSEFILGDNPKNIIEKLAQDGSSQTVCGKVFKIGEPTYSCRECGMDSTCVLCVGCFKLSAHRHHKYKMCTSAGGGCCDCGDVEAWKKDPFCEHHLRAKENDMKNNIITENMKKRCILAFEAILFFSINYLEIETKASLECLDGDGADDDNFCTMLYNDESHTFDQVIQALTKVTNCPSKEANEIVASIDREGRAIVRCDTFSECNQLREAIERQIVQPIGHQTNRPNQALKVSVLHVRAVACQQFALQLLNWFQEFLIYHRSFRQIFSQVILDKKAPYSIRHILEHDVKLWKSARTSWHRLLISGMLLEYDNKFALAEEFSKNYATIVQDFISDDHDHAYSIVSLSVQLFTVPSISHYLIAREGIFHKLMHTFYHRSIEEFIQNKTLHFSKVATTFSHFRRSTYILYDLRYILSFKPTLWSEDLREGFIEGCKVLLRVLNAMQGMEAITRQTGNHMDYEPEWECAFNVHIKLANAITLILEWCGSDQQVLIKIYQMVLRYLSSNSFIVGDGKTHEVIVCNHKAKCLTYDVATKPVSIHLPLSRFFAGIYLHLGKFGLNYDSINTLKRTPEELMQPILCTQAMIAQVHAGMWRRNGYSLLHQLYFYRNVRCRVEMLDRDIVGMQIAASLIESNQYLIHILDKFRLLDWLTPGEKTNPEDVDDDFIKQLSIVDEFLEFMIVIIGERYIPGISEVTEEDRTRKEIIQLLCIKAFSHSELSRSLPDNNNNEMALENVIDSVAVFKMPQCSDSKGVYELKEELYDEYNMYFYHYTKEEKSKSEESQRNRRKLKGKLVCCPPPKLPKLTESFVTIANLLQCDVMMTIINTIIERAHHRETKNFQESHLQKVLYLIGYALQEEESGHYPFLTFCQNSQNYNLLHNLELLLRCAHVEAHRDFIIWVIRKFKDVQQMAVKTQPENMFVEECENAEEATEAASKQDEEKEDNISEIIQKGFDKKIRSRLVANRRAKILAQMQMAQKTFMDTHADLFAIPKDATSSSGEHTKEKKSSRITGGSTETKMDWEEGNQITNEDTGAVACNTEACLGFDRRVQQHEEEKLKCILCFEEATVTKKGQLLVYLAFMQKSKILRSEDDGHIPLHTSSCGHVMHITCWREYYNNEENKELRRPRRQLSLMISSLQSNIEFLCPYCRCMGNSIIPVTVPISQYSPPIVVHNSNEVLKFEDWVDIMSKYGDKLQYIFHSKDLDTCSQNMPNLSNILEEDYCHLNPKLLENLGEPIRLPDVGPHWKIFIEQYMKFLPRTNDEGLLYTWHSCIYTIQILELYLRAVNKPLKGEMSIRHKSCLSGLIHLSCLYPTTLDRIELKGLFVLIMTVMRSVFNQDGTSVLEWDCFSKMVTLILMLPNILYVNSRPSALVVNGSMLDFYLLQMFFLAQMAKAIMLYEDNSDGMDIDDNDYREYQSNESGFENIWLFYTKFNIPNHKRLIEEKRERDNSQTSLELNSDLEETSIEDINRIRYTTCGVGPIDKCRPHVVRRILRHIKTEMRQFLRCSCLFFHFVTDVDFPDNLAKTESDTFENMCKYLGLNSDIGFYFEHINSYAKILEAFATHPDILTMDVKTLRKKDSSYSFKLIPCTIPIPKLVTLPEDYSDLINSVSDFTCPNDERDELKTPTMCLVCGEILCGQSYCCQPELEDRPVGTCTYHTFKCCAEVGIFLRIRDCQVVYLGRNKGCFVHPPYLDQYGETDMGLRRGNPLHLCSARYSKIHLAWLDHGLHEEIARSSDNSSSAGTQWHLM